MSRMTLSQLLTSLIAARVHTPALIAIRQQCELRQLQRTLAAARLGVGWPRARVLQSEYPDLRAT
jgi:hypothetical protein